MAGACDDILRKVQRTDIPREQGDRTTENTVEGQFMLASRFIHFDITVVNFTCDSSDWSLGVFSLTSHSLTFFDLSTSPRRIATAHWGRSINAKLAEKIMSDDELTAQILLVYEKRPHELQCLVIIHRLCPCKPDQRPSLDLRWTEWTLIIG